MLEWMKKESKEEPKLWGNAIIGFGNIIYTSPATGREVESLHARQTFLYIWLQMQQYLNLNWKNWANTKQEKDVFT